jgi:hypothetical protein
MRAFPTVKDLIVGNEPNQSRFWQPQFDSRGRSAAPAAYLEVLARSYDALKGFDPTINSSGSASRRVVETTRLPQATSRILR